MPYSLSHRASKWCVVGPDGDPAPGGCHQSRRDALAHQRALMANVDDAKTAALSDPFPLDPPAEWFTEMPAWFQPGMKASVITEGPDAGRFAATVADRRTYILGGGTKWQSPSSPSNYEEAMQGDTYTASGSVIKTANIAADLDHIGQHASFSGARDAMANTGTALARVRYMDVDGRTVALGALWPGLTDLQVRKLQASALSGDWRWREEYGGYDLAGAIAVNTPGLPLPDRPVFQPQMMAAALGVEHPPIVGGWSCDDEGVCTLMPQEPVLTLTLTASETARLHTLLTAPQVAAVGACSCGAHTAAAPVGDGTNAPPAPTKVDDASAGSVSRDEFAALVARVDALEQSYMDDQLSDIDGMVAALPEPVAADA